WRSKNRAVENEGMEFAVFAARIDAGRQIAQQRFVVCTAGESRTDAIFHAGKISLVTKRDDAARKFGGLAFPDRKNPAHAGSCQACFAPRSQVLQKQISKSHRENSFVTISRH